MHKLVDSVYDALTPEERVAQICATSAGNLAGSDGRFSAEKARAHSARNRTRLPVRVQPH